jgi:lysophospholipase L1-like esterase
MRRAVSRLATLGLVLASGAAALVLADRVVGRIVDVRFEPLRGAPRTHSVLARPEFHVPVRTNAAGFRGPELPGPKARGVYRIVVLGDSFTWGYGVRERQAFPARLEHRLNRRRDGRRVEVVNLGIPGTGPRDYLWHLEHSGLALVPDLVVVGVFANDVNDVDQLRRFGFRSPLFALSAARAPEPVSRPWWKRAVERTTPTLYALAGRAASRVATAPHEATAAPRAPVAPDPEAVLARLGARYGREDAVLARYRVLAPADRAPLDGLLRGDPLGEDMRPVMRLAALVDPDAESDGVLLRSDARRAAWDETADVLARIVQVARRAGARTVLAVLPASEQVNRERWPLLEAIGFRLDPAMLVDSRLDDGISAVAAREGAGCVDLVKAFRAHRGADLYYRLDEHWNARGQAFAAARLATALARRIGDP